MNYLNSPYIPRPKFSTYVENCLPSARMVAALLHSELLLLICENVTSLVARSCHIPGDDVCVVA